MDTFDAIRSRRNVRDFEERPLARAVLDRILEAARRTPSSTNWQPWDFVVVTDAERLRRLAEVWRGGRHVATSAATIALIAPANLDPMRREWMLYDFGQATMSIMLAAADMGVGSGHSAVRDRELAREVLGLPDDRECEYLIALGFPAGRPLVPIERPTRRDFEDVVHWERW